MEDGEARLRERTPTVSWFELFYDLVVVAAVSLTNDVYLDHPTDQTALLAILTMTALAWVWFLTTLYNNIFPSNDLGRRFLMLVQMAAIAVAGLSVDQDHGVSNRMGLGMYGLSLAIVVALNIWGSLLEKQPVSRVSVVSGSVAAAICFVGAADDNLRARYYLIAALIVSMAPILGRQFGNWPNASRLRLDHLRERLGIFVLIIIGEGFSTLVSALHYKGAIPHASLFALLFLLSFAVWWIYFDGTFSQHTNLSLVRWRLSLLCHLTLVWGIAGTLDIMVQVTAGEITGIGDRTQWYFVLCLALVLLSFAGLTYTTKGRLGPQGWLQVGCALLIVAVGIAFVPRTVDYLYWVMGLSGLIVVLNAVVAVLMDHGTRRDRWLRDLNEALRGDDPDRVGP